MAHTYFAELRIEWVFVARLLGMGIGQRNGGIHSIEGKQPTSNAEGERRASKKFELQMLNIEGCADASV
jgi:hypothetical protein